MSAHTLVLPAAIANQLTGMAAHSIESGAVLLARPSRLSDGGVRLIGFELHPVPDDGYLERTDRSLGISSDGYMPALRRAEEAAAVAIWVHTHPGDGSPTRPSRRDLIVNDQLTGTFADRSGSGLYGALIVGVDDGTLTFTGELRGATNTPIGRMFVVGDRFQLLQAEDADRPTLPAFHDRHVRAFGSELPRVLGVLRVAIVGAGGTGSSVAEQLARLGVRDFVLVDPKRISESNPTRVYGSTPRDVGRYKVEVLGEHLNRIADGVHVDRVIGTVSDRLVAEQIVGADVVFGCTDDDAGRVRLSRFSYMYLAPMIDCGIQISAHADGSVRDIVGRVTVLHPGAACLIRRGRVSIQIAAAQERPVGEQAMLAAEGYAPALGATEPAVVAFTTAVAAATVNELLERLVGYGPTPPPSEVLLRIHERRVSENHLDPTPMHYCDLSGRAVFGDSEPYWGLQWPA